MFIRLKECFIVWRIAGNMRNDTSKRSFIEAITSLEQPHRSRSWNLVPEMVARKDKVWVNHGESR